QIAYGPGGRPASPGLGVAATHRLGSGAAQEHEGGADRGGTSLGALGGDAALGFGGACRLGGGAAQAALGGDAALGVGGAHQPDTGAAVAATRRSSTAVLADSVVELRKQHLAAPRPWASEVPTISELLLLKQHLDMAATRLSASVVLAD
ncbi:hypothetical protein PF005_g33097, partial [Phytophthora fragariae]